MFTPISPLSPRWQRAQIPSAAPPETGSVWAPVVSPAETIKPTRARRLASHAGDFITVAGMNGIDPRTDMLVVGEEARVRQAFLMMVLIAESEGVALSDAVRLVISVSDMLRFRQLVSKIQAELWRGTPHPLRTIVEMRRLNQDDSVEVEGTFWVGRRRER